MQNLEEKNIVLFHRFVGLELYANLGAKHDMGADLKEPFYY